MKPTLLTAAGNPDNQDRGLVIYGESKVVLCVADGAGGLSGGTRAAIAATQFVQENVSAANSPELCSELLRCMDAVLAKDTTAGETTCALAVVTSDEILGASVGDSGVWLIPSEGKHRDLTIGQQRKPLLGSGSAWPVAFRHAVTRGFLLLATDGLLKYTGADRITDTCRQFPVETAVQRLIELVRYPSGALPDDVTLILTKL